MRPSSFHFLPFPPVFIWVFILLLAGAILLIEIGVLKYAYEKMGVSRQYVFALLALCLLGGYVNIPVAELPPEEIHSRVVVNRFGTFYVTPSVENWHRTVLAVNVGGALVPAGLSIYLLIKNEIYWRSLLGIALVAFVVNSMSQPVRGMGISVPLLLPPVIAAVIALILSRQKAAPLAYVAGTLGTLIGGDLMNLGRIAGLGAPIASIGGAGTFDGVFLTGIIAVLLA